MNGKTTHSAQSADTGSRKKTRQKAVNSRSAASRLSTLLRRQGEELPGEETLYRAIVENQTELICRFLPDGTLTFVNRAYSDRVGRSRKELLGQNFFSFIPSVSRGSFRKDISSLSLDNPVTTHECSLAVSGGVLRCHEWSERAICDEQGSILEYQAVGRDITDRISYERKISDLNRGLETQVDELRRANDELKTFTYSVSHDLRAPIMATRSLLDRLIEKYGHLLDDKGRHLLSLTNKSVRQMEDLVRGLLSFFNLRHDTIRYESVNMDALVREIFDELSVANTDVVLQLELKPLPSMQGDEKMMRQVLVNLMSNAVKFSKPKGRVVIEVGGRTEGEAVTYYVRDNGIGFPAQQASRIFKIFERLRSRDEFEGSGIGLALVEHIVERHGGTVWAEGLVNQGATLYFSLPLGQRTIRETDNEQ